MAAKGGLAAGGAPPKGAAFLQGRRQSRFGLLPFEDLDSSLRPALPDLSTPLSA